LKAPTAALLALFLLAAGLTAGESELPRLQPLAGAPPHPADNSPTPEKIVLGRELFFDNILSGDHRRSCSSCHKPELFFTDGFSRAWGLSETELRRKTPTVLNVGWQQSMFFDSREKTLEDQVSKPLENSFEMDLSPDEAVDRLKRDGYYVRLFEKAFPGEPLTFDLVAKAVASYERTLVSYDSDLDRYLLGDDDALGAEAKRGMALFSGKAGCIGCHSGPMLTDHQKHYTGVHEDQGDNPAGTKYKTQSLRDVMRRYSFMHNGNLLKIQDVIGHYAKGGSAPPDQKAEIEPFEISIEEQSDLIAFLRSFNGRVTELVEASPQSTDLFTIRRTPRRQADSGPTQDPNYIKKEEGPLQDPNYIPRKRQ